MLVWQTYVKGKQLEAAAHPKPNVAVVAGPGTGKTRTLVGRALFRVQHDQVDPADIRILNFTNNGVRDIRAKLQEPDFMELAGMRVSTFHATALEALIRLASSSLPKPARVLDDWEEHFFIDRHVKDALNLRDVRAAKKIREDYNARWCLAEDAPGDWLQRDRRSEFEGEYQRLKDALGFITRGELTFLWWKTLRGIKPGSPEEAGIQQSEVFVDEYQDLNACEIDILELLAGAGVRVFAVGDPNQSIYESLRHAHPELCWEFKNRLPDAAEVVFDESHRCPREVLEFAKALMEPASGVPDPKKATKRGEATILAYPSASAEISGTVQLARQALSKNPEVRIMVAVPSKDIGKAIVAALETDGTPVDDRTARADSEDIACRLAKAYLAFLKQDRDSVALATLLSLTGPKSRQVERYLALLKECFDQSIPAAKLIDESNLPLVLASSAVTVNANLQVIRDAGEDFLEEIEKITGCSIEADGGEDENNDDRANSNEGSKQLEPGVVTVMTVHGSKGLEADHVFLPTVEPGSYERGLLGREREERRRLLFVGLTRAETRLVISYAGVRYGPSRYRDPGGSSPRKGPSAFLDDICGRLNVTPRDGSLYVKQQLAGP